MHVGDFPTVFPTIMKCWLNNGIIHTYALYILHKCTCTYILDVSKRGVLGSADDDIDFFCIFCHFLLIVFLLIMNMFFGKYLQILQISIYNLQYDVACFLHSVTLCIVHEKICLQFTCIFCIFAVHGRHGRKMRKTFWSFRGFRTK